MGGRRLITSFERRSIVMMLSVASMAAGGVAFNAIAVRTTSAEQLGLYASLFFWMALVNNVTALGLPAVVSRLPRYDLAVGSSFTRRAFVVTSITSVLGAAPIALLATQLLRPALSTELHRWPIGLVTTLLCVLAAGMALSVLVEIRMVALGMYHLAVARAAVTNIARCALIAVPWFRSRTMLTLTASIGATALSGIIGATVLAAHGRRHHATRTVGWRDATPEARAATANWLATLALVTAQYAFPVLTNLTPAEDASFFLAWQMMAVLFLVPTNIGVALTIDASGVGASAPLRRALLLSCAVACAAAVGAVVLARPIQSVLFTDRFREATDVLPILLAATIPWAVISTLLAAARAEGRHGAIVATSVGFGGATALVLAATRPGTPTEAAMTWLGTVSAAMAVAIALDLYSRRRRLHSPRMGVTAP